MVKGSHKNIPIWFTLISLVVSAFIVAGLYALAIRLILNTLPMFGIYREFTWPQVYELAFVVFFTRVTWSLYFSKEPKQ